MLTGLLHTHTYLRYLILALLLVVIVKSAIGLFSKKEFTKLDKMFASMLMGFCHLQALVGIGLYFMKGWNNFQPTTMSDKALRYWSVEHLAGMLIAVIVISIGTIGLKKLSNSSDKFKRLLTYNSIAIIMVVTILSMSGRGIL